MVPVDVLLISSDMIVKVLMSMLTFLYVVGQGKCFFEVCSNLGLKSGAKNVMILTGMINCLFFRVSVVQVYLASFSAHQPRM